MARFRRWSAFALMVLSLVACRPPRADLQEAAGSWPFTPPRDAFSADAQWDLRYLNEKVAGESGYLTVDELGDFRLGSGKPVRFWCVNSGVGRERPWQARPLGRQTEPDLAHHARWLAKRGVNMVRLHTQLSPDLQKNPNAKITDVNLEERDGIWRAAAAYKKEGIYLTVSPYWGVPMEFAAHWNVPGGTDQSALGLLFFDPQLQAAYKAWLRALLAEPNPYTGIPLAKDPVLGIFQIQNEDSLLFWTVNNLQGAQRKNLGRKFAAWAAKKHGSLDAALKAWPGAKLEGDDSAAGVLDFYNVWEMTQERTGGVGDRLADQLEFWCRTMYDFNAEIGRYLRDDLGCKALVNAGNWRTASSERLFDAERWTYTANQVDAVNHYFGGLHRGPNEGWAIVNGDKFTSVSALKEPWQLPINLRQTKGRPMLVTESCWVPPNGYGSEGPFLIAAYQSVTGVDGYYWFATGDDEWTEPTSANGYMPSLAKWTFATPDVVGGFPGAALMYRRGDLRRADPALVEQRSLADLWGRVPAALPEESGFDPNRDASPNVPGKGRPDALAFLQGPVQVLFAGASSVKQTPREGAGATIKSLSKEVVLDYAKGYCTVDTPNAQGVSAFFTGAPKYALSTVEFECDNAYGTALAISLDAKPLATSEKVMVQFVTDCRPAGWQDRPTEIEVGEGRKVLGREVVSYGKAPWMVTDARLRVAIRNRLLTNGRALDANGLPTGSVAIERDGSVARLRFPTKGTLAVVLTKN
ncbi:MAG: hypothetical protein KIS66_04595 [Fimbriimonadaceae bacterium]|nr:hypothetical protein [Fimbriimonadaceae bacterium]